MSDKVRKRLDALRQAQQAMVEGTEQSPEGAVKFPGVERVVGEWIGRETVNATTIAQRLGVSRPLVARWAASEGFPRRVPGSGPPVWWLDEVEAWAIAKGRKIG